MAKHSKPFFSPDSPRLWIAIFAVLGAILLATGVVLGGIWLARQAATAPESAAASSSVMTTATPATTTETTLPPTTTATDAPQVVFKELTFSSPSKTKFTTEDSTLAFMGSTDPRSTLTVDGQPVALSTIGGFSIDRQLKPGINTFRFVSGDKTVTFQVTYQINILRSVTPTEKVTLSGGGSVQFRALAHKNAELTAKFCGTSRSMTPVVEADAEAFHDGSDFITYQATFSLPDGTVGQEKNLGAATITARYNGLTKTMTTASVLLQPEADSSFVIVTRDYAETFSGDVVNDLSRPTNAYLPAGTVDRIVGTGSAAGNTYYRLGCGQWVYTKDVERTTAVTAVPTVPLTGGGVTVTQQATAIRFDAGWKIPYNLQLLPQTYAAPSANVPDYAITAQTTDYVDITFFYVAQAPAAPDVSDSPLFSQAIWRQEKGNHVLRLMLQQRGRFYGYSVKWDNNTLIFSFKHPNSGANNPAAKPLQGIRIVLDPGHGGSSSGTHGTIAGYYEKTATLEYSLLLRDKLTTLGAEIMMTRTTDVLPDDPTMSARTTHARGGDTDLLLSIHMNGSQYASASGCTLHYFNEYSYDMARRLTDTMRAVERQHGIGNRDKVTVWSPFFMARVHDCPAVLVECGFMTNAENMQKLIDTGYKNQMTDAIVQAVVGYFKALPVITVAPPPTTTVTTTTETTGLPTTTTTTVALPTTTATDPD